MRESTLKIGNDLIRRDDVAVIVFKQKGDFSKANRFFERVKESVKLGDLDKYGQEGVIALAAATPKDTGFTAQSWYYEIVRDKNAVSIFFNNSHINKGVPIAIILQYGHGTRNGGFVQGRDYINPAVRPIFDEIANKAWEEVNRA